MNLQGVFTALVTPFQDGAVDLDSLAAICQRQMDAGVAGLVPCGTTGESPTLDEEEWASVVSTAVKVADGRVPVIAGCGSNSTAKTVTTVGRAKTLGADAALVVFPYYNKPNFTGHRAHIEACARVGLPLVLYHVPGRTGQRLTVEQLTTLCEIAGVAGIKEATGDVALGIELLARTSIPVLSGDDHTATAHLTMGGHGTISVVSNIAPAQTVALANAARSGDLDTARQLHQRLLPLIQFLFSDSNPIPVKAALAELGLCSNELRLPLAPSSPPPPGLLTGVE